VRLHYLDFGGTGEALLLMAGLGDGAHVFDEFAPRFIDAFHVLALTRRGFGESSQPATGYDTVTLAEDIAHLLDGLAIDRVHLAGHSLAGAEMTEFAVRHPGRTIKLVYLDAAYDWAASALSPNPSAPPSQPSPTTTELASPEGFASYVARVNGVSAFPLADIRATNVFECGGRYLGSRTPAAIAMSFASLAAAQHPNYAGVNAPALAIFTVPLTPTDMFPWLTRDGPQWPVAAAYFPFAQDALASQRTAFAASAPGAIRVELPSVPHFLFLSQPDTVAASMRAFLEAP
jgi:pimeloyl-ACP methyl ester carboxylesterase